jgi:MFS transporter, PAT family, beta-lactamase induction signal transducer AmpG
MSTSIHTSNILINTRLLAILVLGFSSGLPLALTGSTLQAWVTEAHIDIVTIGALSLIGIPYTFKFLWAPLMDHVGFPHFGKRKGWILLMQAALIIALLVLAHLDPAYQTMRVGIVALAVAFFSASQDISINAYTTDVLTPKERGLGAAYTVFAYRIAVLISGGFALICADQVGWKITYEIMAFLLFLSMLATLLAPRPVEFVSLNQNLFQTTLAAIGDLLEREKIILLLLFIVFYKFGDALALQLMTNFLLHGLGFTLTQVGLAYKIVSFIAMILGGFVGGVILTRWTIYRALLLFGLAQAFSNLMFVILAMVGKHFMLMTVSIFIENFCSGLSTAALLTLMMSLCNHRYTASQFALLSAAASLGRVFLGPVAGLMVENLGWVQFYIWSFVLCFPGIIFLVLLKDKVLYHVQATAD